MVHTGEMNDDEVLASLLRRFIDSEYFWFGRYDTVERERRFTLDGTIEVTDDELAVLFRLRQLQ